MHWKYHFYCCRQRKQFPLLLALQDEDEVEVILVSDLNDATKPAKSIRPYKFNKIILFINWLVSLSIFHIELSGGQPQIYRQ